MSPKQPKWLKIKDMEGLKGWSEQRKGHKAVRRKERVMGQGGGRGEVTGWRDGWWVGDGKKPSTTRSSMMERREKHGKGEERADMTRRGLMKESQLE